MKRILVILFCSISLVLTSQSYVYYVAPTGGSDSNAGTNIAAPWATWQKALNTAQAGDTVYFRGGVWYHQAGDTYDLIPAQGKGHSGTTNNYVHYLNYPGEVPILDGSQLIVANPGGLNGYSGGVYIDNANYIHWKGLTIRNYWQIYNNVYTTGLVAVESNHQIFENITVHNISGRGIYYSPNNGSDTTYFLNCDVYNCIDSMDTGGNQGGWADGWNAGNIDPDAYLLYDGCRAWHNSDDGFNGWGYGLVEFRNCWSFLNGVLDGDGDGFKLNPPETTDFKLTRLIHNNIAAFNGNVMGDGTAGIGIDENNGGYYSMEGQIYNNTSYHNYIGFATGGWLTPPQKNNDYRNNISLESLWWTGQEIDVDESKGASMQTNIANTWTEGVGFTITNADFISSDSTTIINELSAARKADGSLPDITALTLSSESDLIDAGVDVGFPYSGLAPDLGYAEYGEQTIDSTATDIITFTLTEQSTIIDINAINHTIDITITYGNDITDITPTITLSYGATISPLSNTSQNFTNPVEYTVTSLNEEAQQVWTVTISVESEAAPVTSKFIKLSGGKFSSSGGRFMTTNYVAPELISVTSINVAGEGGATTISVDDETLQIYADVSPDNATDTTVIWSRVNRTGTGSIGSNGLLTALTNGIVTVRATAHDGTSIYDTLQVTLSNQVENAAAQIIADHTSVDAFDDIPANWIDSVKQMFVAFYGESHSGAYDNGMVLLEALNGTYACNVASGESPTDQYVRVEDVGAGIGEGYFWVWYSYPVGSRPNTWLKDRITDYNSDGHPFNAIGFGWCADMTSSDNGYSSTTDPVYGVHWYGRSQDGIDGDSYWGLDAGDYSITGNRVSLATYFGAMEEMITYCASNSPATKMVFTTGPVDVTYGEFIGEAGYQGHLKHEAIRDYVASDETRILFDYADILCYDNNGTPTTQTWSGHTYPAITSANFTPIVDAYHISEIGAIRLAKAQWWMLARMAGWDGIAE